MSRILAGTTLADFAAALAAPEPTPGGGSASAAAVAMAAGLAGMVAGLSIGRTPADASDERWRTVIDEAAKMRAEALDLADQDARAFDGVMAALRLPKGTGEEKATRRDALVRANRAASLVPLRTAETGLAVLRLAFLAAGEGNQRTVSDAGVAGALALAGVRGAILNVRINLPSLPEEERRALEDRLAPLEEEALSLARRIEERVAERM